MCVWWWYMWIRRTQVTWLQLTQVNQHLVLYRFLRILRRVVRCKICSRYRMTYNLSAIFTFRITTDSACVQCWSPRSTRLRPLQTCNRLEVSGESFGLFKPVIPWFQSLLQSNAVLSRVISFYPPSSQSATRYPPLPLTPLLRSLIRSLVVLTVKMVYYTHLTNHGLAPIV